MHNVNAAYQYMKRVECCQTQFKIVDLVWLYLVTPAQKGETLVTPIVI